MCEDKDQYRYFEFSLRQICEVEDTLSRQELTFLSIKDITAIVKGVKKQTDVKYMDAIEANYSHE